MPVGALFPMEGLAMKFLRHDDLKAKGIQWSRTHIIRLERAGKFPKRVRIGANSFGYVAEEIDNHIAQLAAARAI
jgi:prophage regulatory protein